MTNIKGEDFMEKNELAKILKEDINDLFKLMEAKRKEEPDRKGYDDIFNGYSTLISILDSDLYKFYYCSDDMKNIDTINEMILNKLNEEIEAIHKVMKIYEATNTISTFKCLNSTWFKLILVYDKYKQMIHGVILNKNSEED
jgi:hypothetical protein